MNQANLNMMVSRLTNHNQPDVGTLQYKTAHFQYLGSIKIRYSCVVISKSFLGIRLDIKTNS